jgi:hypothetical protein
MLKKKLISIAHKLIPMKSDTLPYTVDELNGIYVANSNFVQIGLGSIFNEDFKYKKTSDTLYILGSGPSINHLSSKCFSLIKEADSIGFNFWFAHEFVPSFYCFQHTRFGGERT